MIETLLSVILLVLLLVLLNPLGLWMPDSMHMMILLGVVIVFAVFSVFVYREKAQDEREVLHRFIAGRFAYLIGTSILVLGIVYEALNHVYNTWLIITLVAMILAKMIGVMYGKMRY